MAWTWRLESHTGEPVTVDVEGAADATFPTRADAESWVGEVWQDLLAAGVDAVRLFEDDREVYGPMSLHSA